MPVVAYASGNYYHWDDNSSKNQRVTFFVQWKRVEKNTNLVIDSLFRATFTKNIENYYFSNCGQNNFDS